MNLNDDFVEFEGRQVPTENGMRKMNLLVRDEDNPDDEEYGTMVTVRTTVTDEDFRITPDKVRSIVWNLKKYSSITFMKQTREMLVNIAQGYEKYLEGKDCTNDDIANVKNINNSIAMLDKGIELRAKGDVSACALLEDVYTFDRCFFGRIGDECDWSTLGRGDGYKKKDIGLFCWIVKARNMAITLPNSLGCVWTWPSSIVDENIQYQPPETFKYVPTKEKFTVKTGDIIPVTGIWNPFDYKSGCPSFLIAGQEFPKISIATVKKEDHEYVDNDGDYHSAWIDFDYEERETQWEILWEDKRYLDGKIPKEEADYLDESCSFPNEPPIAIQN